MRNHTKPRGNTMLEAFFYISIICGGVVVADFFANILEGVIDNRRNDR